MKNVLHTSGGEMRRWRANLVLLATGSLFALLLSELGLRLAGISYPSFYLPDDRLGKAPRPGMKAWYGTEGGALVHFNRQGLRDREHDRQKPPQSLRIAVLGDSYTEALQVPVEKTFWSVMEQEMQHCHNWNRRPVEVLNFGVAGYSTAQELQMLRYRVWNYSPDIILLAMFLGNDISDNLRALSDDSARPYFVHRYGHLQLDDSFRTTFSYRWRHDLPAGLGDKLENGSRVFQVIRHAQLAWKARQVARRRPMASVQAGLEPGLPSGVLRAPMNPDWEEAWRVTEDLIRTMRDEVASKGARLMVVTLSIPSQVNPDSGYRLKLAQGMGLEDLFYPDHRIKAFGEREGIEVLNLALPMQAYAEREHVYLHGFEAHLGYGHWNPRGHRVAGELIARWICENWVP
jgi:lysophospholipase L1-like esterase